MQSVIRFRVVAIPGAESPFARLGHVIKSFKEELASWHAPIDVDAVRDKFEKLNSNATGAKTKVPRCLTCFADIVAEEQAKKQEEVKSSREERDRVSRFIRASQVPASSEDRAPSWSVTRTCRGPKTWNHTVVIISSIASVSFDGVDLATV